jgi:hypothetical protein
MIKYHKNLSLKRRQILLIKIEENSQLAQIYQSWKQKCLENVFVRRKNNTCKGLNKLKARKIKGND